MNGCARGQAQQAAGLEHCPAPWRAARECLAQTSAMPPPYLHKKSTTTGTAAAKLPVVHIATSTVAARTVLALLSIHSRAGQSHCYPTARSTAAEPSRVLQHHSELRRACLHCHLAEQSACTAQHLPIAHRLSLSCNLGHATRHASWHMPPGLERRPCARTRACVQACMHSCACAHVCVRALELARRREASRSGPRQMPPL